MDGTNPQLTRRLNVYGQRLTDRDIRRGLRINIVAGSLAMAWAATQGLPLTMFFEALGASGVVIGLAATIQQAAMGVQIPAALYAERLASRKALWAVLAFLHRALWFVPAVLALVLPQWPATLTWTALGVLTVSTLLAYSSAPMWYSWMADLVPTNVSGRFWGRRQSYTMAAFLVSMGVTGWLLDRYSGAAPDGSRALLGFVLCFALGALLGTADIFVHLGVPEPRPTPPRDGQSRWARLAAPLQDRDFRWLTLAMGAWYFSLGLVAFGIIYLKRDFGSTYTHLSVLQISASLGVVAMSAGLGYVIDRLGARALAMILLVVAPAFGWLWFLVSPHPIAFQVPWLGAVSVPQPIVLFTLTNLVAGGLYGGLGLCQIQLLSLLAPQAGRTVAMAVHWTIVGGLGALGPLVGGVLMDYFTVHPLPWRLWLTDAPLSWQHVLVAGHILTAWLICIPLMRQLRRRQGEQPLGEVLARLTAGNPLRTLANFYNLYLIGAGVASEHRARAARKLGEGRTAIAVTDLIAKLDDPSTDVREEAALALGRIGSPEAIDALIGKLEDPESDLAPQIARALRASRDPRGVDVLVRRLADGDRETRSESARALGEIGDPRAVRSLLAALRQTNDTKLLSASSEALARLGHLAAIYEILPRLKETRNPVLRRSLAVAVGDLLGTPGEFYQILTAELDTPGTAAERLLREFSGAVQRDAPAALQQQSAILANLAAKLEIAYADERGDVGTDLLLDLGIRLAAVLYRVHQQDPAGVIDDLIWHDEQFAVGLWYLNLLHERWPTAPVADRDRLDLLLGIYFLHSQLPKLQEPGPGRAGRPP